MKRYVILILTMLMLAGGSSAAARPARCIVVLDEATRNAAVTSLQDLMAASLRLGNWMVDLATIQEAHRVIGALEDAPTYGCEPEAR